MKNIHVLPTDKPSRIHLWTDELGTRLEFCDLEYSHTRNTQHIYITSNEEIKQGDWFYDNDGELCKYTSDYVVTPNKWSDNQKIILTTDQDLIDDGVQDITKVPNYEFLYWFVKNPRTMFVEIEKQYSKWDIVIGSVFSHYKIIIPQEESKQETLEEAAEAFAITIQTKEGTVSRLNAISWFIAGAKWQLEQLNKQNKTQ